MQGPKGSRSRQGKAAVPAPAADTALPKDLTCPGGVRACLLLWEKNPPQHLKAGNAFSRQFKSTFPPRLRPAAFPKEVAKPSGLRHTRGAAEGGRCGAPTASGPGTAVRGRGPTAPRSGPEPRARNRRRTAPPAPQRRQSGTGERGGTAPPHPAARPRRGLSPAGPDPSRRAARAPRRPMAGTGLFLRVHGQGGRDPCGGHACGTGLCRREVPAGTAARLGRGRVAPEDAAGAGRDRGTHAHPLHCPRGCSPCAVRIPARDGSTAIFVWGRDRKSVV